MLFLLLGEKVRMRAGVIRFQPAETPLRSHRRQAFGIGQAQQAVAKIQMQFAATSFFGKVV